MKPLKDSEKSILEFMKKEIRLTDAEVEARLA